MTPQLNGVMPPSLNFFTAALRSSVVDFSGRWKSLIETYCRPTRWIAATHASRSLIARRVYDATPIFRPFQ